MERIARYRLIAAVVLGLVIVGSGILFVASGLDARAEIKTALIQEEVITSRDSAIPGVLVQDTATARAQQDAIESHTYGKWGPYSGMDREDPNREVYLKGLTLRNSLNLAVMGFGLADLAIGTGAVAIALGLAITGLAVPGLFLMRQPELLMNRRSIPRVATA